MCAFSRRVVHDSLLTHNFFVFVCACVDSEDKRASCDGSDSLCWRQTVEREFRWHNKVSIRFLFHDAKKKTKILLTNQTPRFEHRAQDISMTDLDKVQVYKCFRPGDIVVALVVNTTGTFFCCCCCGGFCVRVLVARFATGLYFYQRISIRSTQNHEG